MLYLEKFLERSFFDLFLFIADGSSMKTGKWSLISDTMTPLTISSVTMFVRM